METHEESKHASFSRLAEDSRDGVRHSVRRPADVKLKTLDEERAANALHKSQRRETSAEPKEAMNIDRFEVLGLMGQGSYGKVYLAQKKRTGKYYAIKAISKQKIMRDGKQHEVFRERQALVTLDHPNIVRLHWSFNVSHSH